MPAWWQQVPGSERRSGQLWGNPTPYQGSKKVPPEKVAGLGILNLRLGRGAVFKPTCGQSNTSLSSESGKKPQPGEGRDRTELGTKPKSLNTPAASLCSTLSQQASPKCPFSEASCPKTCQSHYTLPRSNQATEAWFLIPVGTPGTTSSSAQLWGEQAAWRQVTDPLPPL